MKPTPPPDPLLDAVLAADPALRMNSLGGLLAAARHRRRQRALRRGVLLTGLPVLAAVAVAVAVVWDSRTPGSRPGETAAFTLVRTGTRPTFESISNANFPVLPPPPTRATGEDLVFAVTRPDSVELTQGDLALLDLLPGGAGFIGDGEDRQLVWLAGEVSYPATGP